MRSFDTSTVQEFSQLFEACTNLTEIKGIETWNTSNGKTFTEMFSGCRSIEVLDIDNFDTTNCITGFKVYNGGHAYEAFDRMFSGMSSLRELHLGDKFSFDGDGTVIPSQVAVMPAPAAIDGVATKWYNAANDTYYAADEIPEETAAIYVAKVPE